MINEEDLVKKSSELPSDILVHCIDDEIENSKIFFKMITGEEKIVCLYSKTKETVEKYKRINEIEEIYKDRVNLEEGFFVLRSDSNFRFDLADKDNVETGTTFLLDNIDKLHIFNNDYEVEPIYEEDI
jgi:hypothetical protein